MCRCWDWITTIPRSFFTHRVLKARQTQHSAPESPLCFRKIKNFSGQCLQKKKTGGNKTLNISTSSLSRCRAPQYILWEPGCPTQSSAEWRQPFRCGRPRAVQLCSWLRLGWPCHTHLHHQCWERRSLGLSCSHLSRYDHRNMFVCLLDCMWRVLF